MKSLKMTSFDKTTMGLAVFFNNECVENKEGSIVYTKKDSPLTAGIIKQTENGKLVLMNKAISLLYDGEIIVVDNKREIYASQEENDLQNPIITVEKEQIPLEMGNLLSCLIKDQKELEADGLLVTTITRGYMKSVKKILQKEKSIFTKISE